MGDVGRGLFCLNVPSSDPAAAAAAAMYQHVISAASRRTRGGGRRRQIRFTAAEPSYRRRHFSLSTSSAAAAATRKNTPPLYSVAQYRWITPPPIAERSIAISMSVCLSEPVFENTCFALFSHFKNATFYGCLFN